MEAITEIQALQNAANDFNLIIYEKPTQDKRKTVKHYFANRGNETVSPNLDYENMNHFLLGWIKANKYKSKVEKAAPELLEALKLADANILGHGHFEGTRLHQIIKEAINKATN